MNRFFTHALLHLLLLSQLFVLGPGGGLVMCVGADGHSRLELAMSSCCGEEGLTTPEDASSPQELDRRAPSGCGSCSDQMIPIATRFSRSMEESETAAVLAPPLAEVREAPPGTCAPRAFPVPAPAAPPRHLTLLAGVVLRC